MDERELVRRAQTGDTEAFGALVAAHQQFVYNLAWRALGDAHEAEDAAQEALVRAWLALPNFRGQAQFRTWLYRIVTNLCCNRLPRLRRDLLALGDDEAGEVPDVAHADPADLEVSTGYGSIHSDLPVSLQGDLDPDHWRGTLNGGGPRLSVSTDSGSITLTLLES